MPKAARVAIYVAKVLVALCLIAWGIVALCTLSIQAGRREEMYGRGEFISPDGKHSALWRVGSESPHREVILDGKTVVSLDSFEIWDVHWLANNKLEVVIGDDHPRTANKHLAVSADDAKPVLLVLRFTHAAQFLRDFEKQKVKPKKSLP